jgi:hypothetical protein
MAKKSKTTYTAKIVGCADDGVNYYIDIIVDMGTYNKAFNVITAISSFTDASSCTTWLTSWVSSNKASFLPGDNSLFIGTSVTG